MKIFRSSFWIALCAFTLAASAEDMKIEADTFGCIRDMTPVRDFFVDNLLGKLDETLAVAEAGDGTYPQGTVIQLVPTEVMLKHEEGFSPATSDWEFIELDVSAEGSSIRAQGFVDVVNRFGGNCFACHIKANPGRDLVCEQGNGCDTIPLTPMMIKAIQNTDPRCAPIELPKEQQDALQKLNSAMAKP